MGKSTREIAFALTLNPGTVETHIAAISNWNLRAS